MDDVSNVPGFLFFDHVAIAVKQGELEEHVRAYKSLGFSELHREEVLGTDQVREVLLKVGDGPNLVQLLEPLGQNRQSRNNSKKAAGVAGLRTLRFALPIFRRLLTT